MLSGWLKPLVCLHCLRLGASFHPKALELLERREKYSVRRLSSMCCFHCHCYSVPGRLPSISSSLTCRRILINACRTALQVCAFQKHTQIHQCLLLAPALQSLVSQVPMTVIITGSKSTPTTTKSGQDSPAVRKSEGAGPKVSFLKNRPQQSAGGHKKGV
jgi:hypothetical protein